MAARGGPHCLNPTPAAGTHLHRVRLASTCLAVGEDADIEPVDAGGDQGLHLLEDLGRGHGMEGVGLLGPGSPPAPSPATPPDRSLL